MLKNQAEFSVVSSCVLALSPVTTNRLLGASLRWATGSDEKLTGKKKSDSKPKYLQVSCIPFADTLLLIELLFCSFSEFHTPFTAILGLNCSEKSLQMFVILVIVLQEVIVCNLYETIFLNRFRNGEAQNFLNHSRTQTHLRLTQNSSEDIKSTI